MYIATMFILVGSVDEKTETTTRAVLVSLHTGVIDIINHSQLSCVCSA